MDRLTTNIVGPDGPLDAPICFIGQAPGGEENVALKPFVGQAGQLLNRCLKHAGLVRSQVLVWNVFSQRPPKNDVKYYFESHLKKLTWEGEEHVARLKGWLEKLLERRERGAPGPNVIVALGAEALWVLTGHRRITKWRGSVLPCTLVPGFKVYAAFHPSYVNRLMNEPEERLLGMKKTQKQNALPLFLRDLERIAMQGKERWPPMPERKFEIDSPLERILANLNGLLPSVLDPNPQVAVDIETIRTEKGPMVWCIGFALGPSWAFVIPIIKRGKLCWTPQEEAKIWKHVSQVFLNPNVLKIFHNGGYDLSILGRYYGLRVADGSYADTMWCHQATHPYMLKGLDALASIYTWEPYYKDDGKWWDGRRISDEAQFNYNAKDCCVTREIWPLVERDAKQHGTWGNYRRSMRVMPSLLRMMIRGVRINESTKRDLGRTFKERAEEAQRLVQSETDFTDINLGSSSQLQRLLYGYMGLPIQYHHKTKKPTTDKDAINRLRKKAVDGTVEGKVLAAVSDYRMFDKLANTYTEMEVESDGRVRTSYGFVSTFRLSSSESHFGGGGNLQNIPVRTEEGKLIRRLFVPDNGRRLLASDLIQAEAQEVAWLSNDLELIEAFQSREIDVHWLRAEEIFGIPEGVKYHPEAKFKPRMLEEEWSLWSLRYIGKTITYAFQYGMGPRMLQNILIREEVYLEYSTCRELLARASRARPHVGQWQQRVREEIRTVRALVTPLGDRREFHGRLNDNLFRSAYAYVPQSTVGRILQLAIQEIHEKVDTYEPLLNVHDEVVGQCYPEDQEAAIQAIRPLMEREHIVNGRPLTIPCEFKAGPSWGELKEVKDGRDRVT